MSVLSLLLLSSYHSGQVVAISLPRPIVRTSDARLNSAVKLPTHLSPVFAFSRSSLHGIHHRPTGNRMGGRRVGGATPMRGMVIRQNAEVASGAARMNSTCGNIDHVGACSFARHSIPTTFRNFHVTFISSLRCGDLLGRRKLGSLIHLLVSRGTSILLVNNSFRRNYRCIPPIVTTLTRIGAPLNACTILNGGSCRTYCSSVIHRVERCNVRLLRRGISALQHNNRQVLITNIHGPFSLNGGNASPALNLSPSSFMVLLARAPSCTRSIPIAGSSLVLTKRARNKRIALFKLCTPVIPSRCKRQFLSKLGCGSGGVPVVIAGNVNASRGTVHVFTPTRIIVVILRQLAS